MSNSELGDHPIASIFPLLPEAELRELAEDIKTNGVQIPIVLYEGKILDGRNRYRAAKSVGAHFTTNYYSGESPTAHVISLNVHRRHLTKAQLINVALEALPRYEEEAQKRREQSNANREIIPYSDKGKATEHVAKLVGVNPRYVADAKKLKEEEPEIFEKVLSGEVSIPKAKRMAAAKKTAKKTEAPKESKDEEDDDVAYIPSNGLQYAQMAIESLSNIQPNDTQLESAIQKVIKWCNAKLKTK